MKKEKVIRGVALLISLIFAVVLGIGAVAVARLHSTEIRLVRRQNNSTRAIHAAESGINMAIWALNNYYTTYAKWTATGTGWTGIPGETFTDDNDNCKYGTGEVYNDANGNGEYDGTLYSMSTATVPYYTVEVDMIDPGSPTATSIGYSPDTSGATRAVEAMLMMTTTGASPDAITNIITVGGNLTSGGDATITGPTESGTAFPDNMFESIFGMTKDEMKILANVVTDPVDNYTPVEGITWFELDLNTDTGVKISSEDEDGEDMVPPWSGSGIMIVDGYLKITGESTFDGIIWIMGNCDLDLRGCAKINGAIFVEGAADVRGTPELTYDRDAVGGALGVLPGGEYVIDTWKEIQP